MDRFILSELPGEIKFQILTPTKAIANYLQVPHYSLESLAQTTIRQRGWKIASAILSRRLLSKSVGTIIKTKDTEGAARSFLPTIKSLLRGGVNLEALQQTPAPRVQQLGQLAIAYQRELRQHQRIDGAELFWYASQLLATATSNGRSYVIYGYFPPGKDELAFIDRLAGEESIIVLPLKQLDSSAANKSIFTQLEQAIAYLTARGWQLKRDRQSRQSDFSRQVQQCFLEPQSLPPGVKLHTYGNLTEEVRGVLAQVKTLLSQDVATQDVVLVAQDEQLYGTTLIDVAWEYQLNVRVAYEIPLEQTRIGAWLQLLLEVVASDFPFESTAKLLAHPLAQYISPEIWTAARQTHPQGYDAWQKLGIDLSLLPLPVGNHRRDDWWQWLQAILSGWQILEKGKGWSREVLAYYRLQEALAELAQPATVQINRNTFIQELKDTLAVLSVPAQPGRGGVELHTPTSLVGTQYKYVFVLGAADGILPRAIADDLVLDFTARKQLAQQGLAVTTAMEIATQAAFNFYCLLGIAIQELIFSYPQLIEGNSVLPSPYLQRLAIQPQTVPKLPVVSLEAARRLYLPLSLTAKKQQNSLPDAIMPQIIHAWRVETSRESTQARDEYDGVINLAIAPEKRVFSASQLTQLGQCPFKWFAARLLQLQELEEAELSLSSTFRGNLYHRCLELSLQNIQTAADLATFNREQLEQAFRQAEQELRLTELSTWEAQRQEHLELLALNLATAEFLPEAREILAHETKFESQWYGLQVRGTVDRIDRSEQGLTVIDYKTSRSTPVGVKDETGKANIDIQLSLYVDAIAQNYPQESVDAAAYYSLTKRQVMRQKPSTPEQLATFAARVKSHLQQGYYPVAPDLEQKACQYCDFDLVCRQGDRLKRKELSK